MITKLLKADEVASVLDLSKSFVYQLIRTGQLRSVRIGTSVRVRPEDLDAFVQSSLVGADFGPSSTYFRTQVDEYPDKRMGRSS